MPKVERKNIKDKTTQELSAMKAAKAQASVDYIAMMSDIDLPNEEESEVIEYEQEV